MTIDVTCPECGATQTATDEKAGLRMRCRNCAALVTIPAGEGAVPEMRVNPPSKRSSLPPHKSAPRNLRPFIYAGLAGFAVLALSFRWWFNPPRPEPVAPAVPRFPAISQNPPAGQPPAPNAGAAAAAPKRVGSVRPILKGEDKRKSFLKSAREEYVKNNRSGWFVTLLRYVVDELPELQLSTEPGEVAWNRTTLYEDGIYVNAFRFTSPLDVEGDLFWMFVTPEHVGNWSVESASGKTYGYQFFHEFSDAEIEGLDVPRNSRFVAQEIRGGKILPGQTVVVWFSATGDRPLPFSAAVRVVPAKQKVAADVGAQPIFRELGLKFLPEPVVEGQ